MNWIKKAARLPEDAAGSAARMTVIGLGSVTISNVLTLKHVTKTSVMFSLTDASLTISGQDLIVKDLIPSEAVVEGKIESVHLTKSNAN